MEDFLRNSKVFNIAFYGLGAIGMLDFVVQAITNGEVKIIRAVIYHFFAN